MYHNKGSNNNLIAMHTPFVKHCFLPPPLSFSYAPSCISFYLLVIHIIRHSSFFCLKLILMCIHYVSNLVLHVYYLRVCIVYCSISLYSFYSYPFVIFSFPLPFYYPFLTSFFWMLHNLSLMSCNSQTFPLKLTAILCMSFYWHSHCFNGILSQPLTNKQ